MKVYALSAGWDAAASDGATRMAAVCRSQPSEHRDLSDGPHARGDRALSARGGDSSERPCRRAVETVRAAARCSIRGELKDEGLHLILPWDELFLYDLRLQSLTETYNAISSDGVSLTASMNVRFRLQRDATPALHQAIGPDYVQLLARPEIASLTREVMAQYTAEQVYSSARQEIQEKIRSLAVDRLSEKMMEREGGEAPYSVSLRDTLIIYDTLVHGIELPAAGGPCHQSQDRAVLYLGGIQVSRRARTTGIGAQEDRGGGYPRLPADRSQGISDSYLRWRGIEATLQLSQSTNSKVVVIGSAKDGLPIILGNGETPPNTAEAPASDPGAGGKELTHSGRSRARVGDNRCCRFAARKRAACWRG